MKKLIYLLTANLCFLVTSDLANANDCTLPQGTYLKTCTEARAFMHKGSCALSARCAIDKSRVIRRKSTLYEYQTICPYGVWNSNGQLACITSPTQ